MESKKDAIHAVSVDKTSLISELKIDGNLLYERQEDKTLQVLYNFVETDI